VKKVQTDPEAPIWSLPYFRGIAGEDPPVALPLHASVSHLSMAKACFPGCSGDWWVLVGSAQARPLPFRKWHRPLLLILGMVLFSPNSQLGDSLGFNPKGERHDAGGWVETGREVAERASCSCPHPGLWGSVSMSPRELDQTCFSSSPPPKANFGVLPNPFWGWVQVLLPRGHRAVQGRSC
jgi:hypothetical protein